MNAIRPATADDLEVLTALETEIFGADAWSPQLFADELSAQFRTYLVMTDERGAIIGYAGLFAPGAEGDIQTIAVTEAHRGTGLGRELLTALIDEASARHVTQLFLEVREDNEAAQQLYRSNGFEVIGERPGYYQPGNVSALVMRCALPRQSAAPVSEESQDA